MEISAQPILTLSTPPDSNEKTAKAKGDKDSQPSLPIGIHTAVAMRIQMTPPETTNSPQGGGTVQHAPAVFHSYLRALHPFDPSSSDAIGDESSQVTACIRPGDLILVHSIHANGWANGTVLTTGERGWLPTNYCKSYDHSHLRCLLGAMTEFWDLLGASSDEANLSTFVRQDYVRGLIAGVRYLLEHADCLHRDAPLVMAHGGIRKTRKGLLAELSVLVQMARRLQETMGEPFAAEVMHVLLDELVAKAYRVVTRAVGFVDIWTEETTQTSSEIRGTAGSHDSIISVPDAAALSVDVDASCGADSNHTEDPASHSKPFLREEVTVNAADKLVCEAESTPSPRTRTSSTTWTRKTSTANRRLSLGESDGRLSTSEQLAKAHDLCIGNIGGFIGLHLDSRPSSELAAITDRLVNTCTDLLAIVDQVCLHDTPKSLGVRQARSAFQETLEELVKLTDDVFKFFDVDEGNVVVTPAQGNRLVSVGTSLIRYAGECVAKTRTLIDQIGDSDFSGPPSFDCTPQERSPSANSTKAGERPEDASCGAAQLTSFEKRLSRRMIQPTPLFAQEPPGITSEVVDFALASPTKALRVGLPPSSPSAGFQKSLPPLRSTPEPKPERAASGELAPSPRSARRISTGPGRKDSVGVSIAGSTETRGSTVRDSGVSTVSEVSTRATTPDQAKESDTTGLLNSFASLSSTHSAMTEADPEIEARLLQMTYASELTVNKEGQVSAGSLPALVEQLTTHDATPDPQFVSAFYITFRMFTTPREFAQALIARFDYVGDDKAAAGPVRLRIWNAFKGWLETYWNAEVDRDALGDIRYFALHKLKAYLPSAGERLVELTRKVASDYHNGVISEPLVSHVGKTSTSLVYQQNGPKIAPEPIVSRGQLNALRAAALGGAACSVLDVDPIELGRQITLLTSKIFCSIRPDELLSLGWSKANSQKAPNVRNMCTINTDLAHVVGDSVLGPEDAKKRALVIKQWSKVAACCLGMNNYDSLMAIMCSINSSVIQRLKRTWELVSKKTKDRIAQLNSVVDLSRNQTALRRRMEAPVAPCIPFLGIYLTDLTFLDVGNPKTKELPRRASETGETITVINFDKHMRMAKVVSHLQKFQLEYRLQAVPEMQAWMQAYLQRMRLSNDKMIGNFHRRSLYVEPR